MGKSKEMIPKIRRRFLQERVSSPKATRIGMERREKLAAES
jgi:hypothetical protein